LYTWLFSPMHTICPTQLLAVLLAVIKICEIIQYMYVTSDTCSLPVEA
jgi:hypothetical protein